MNGTTATIYKGTRMFRYRLSPETFRYVLTFSPDDRTLKFTVYIQSDYTSLVR